MSSWQSWDTNPPEAGQKVAILCDDGCSMSAALVVADGKEVTALEAEDGWDLGPSGYLMGAMWTTLPDDYPLRFMEADYD